MSELGQNTNLTQTQTIAPQMRKSLDILQSNALELRALVNAELNSNPLLEEFTPLEESVSLDDPQLQANAKNMDEARERMFNSIAARESFQENLRKQASLEIKDAQTLRAFLFLADFLDERGFLDSDALLQAKDEGFDNAKTADALKFMQSCEPAGIGARNFRESFLIQLERKKRQNSLAYAIVESCFAQLEKRKVEQIAKILNTDESSVEDALEEIAHLDIAPAKSFSSEDAQYVWADLRFVKNVGIWNVELTNEYLPQLRINNDYRSMIAQGRLSKNDLSYIKNNMREAKFVIEAIEERQNTLLRIGHTILQLQPKYFEKGADFLVPMTMAQVAEIAGVHPTTVSRAVSGKYGQIGHRFIDLKSFFSGGYAMTDESQSLASSSIKTAIARIVTDEDKSHPLSDSQIADILKERGIDIARRTIAKYRDALNIPAKALRKRYN